MNLFIQAIYIASSLSLAYIFLLYYSNPLRRLPSSVVTASFLIGMFAVIPVIVIKQLIGLPHTASFLTAFVSAGLVEEGIKFALMGLTIWRFRFPDLAEELDVAIYFGILGVGFGIYEDFSYLFSGTYSVWKAGDILQFRSALRALLAARAFPGHILFDSIAGFLVGRARFTKNRRHRPWLILGAFALAVAMHGSFNMIATHGGNIPILTYIVVLVGIFLYLRQRALRRSPFRQLINYMNEGGDWHHERPPEEYLFAEGFSWPKKPKLGMFAFFPFILSLVILYPFLVAAVYLLEQAAIWIIEL